MDCTVRTGCKTTIKAGVVKTPIIGRYAEKKQNKVVVENSEWKISKGEATIPTHESTWY